ncbi:C40 family peptidase [Streptomyces griseoaurantiacus]|uniref:C40 family peptidase n=1 Tax=Streptomyces griseoaurantiacus TaxID=68213 RepID=A0A7W2HXK1_9ACTN|nr:MULTISPECIES: C40 family peptidase [Streptomyces]MBA5225382.1 C40 family peptidase [Streptomyces griseoaurantiacus]
MSHTAHIRSHRKPRRNASSVAVRAGVAGGVLSTLAVAGASAQASAAEPVTQTLELPTLTADLAQQIAQSADATQQAAANYQLRAERDAAAEKAAKEAKADLADAKKEAKAKAEAKRKAEAARKTAEAASRSSDRTTLATPASSGSSTSSSTATGSAAAVVSFVKAQVGKAYVSGATGPSAYDCSGLVQTAFKQVGISLPRVSQSQSTAGTQVSLSNLQPGDILYWGSAGSAYHVGVYVGNGMFVGAQNSSTGVVERPLSYDPPSGAVRVL